MKTLNDSLYSVQINASDRCSAFQFLFQNHHKVFFISFCFGLKKKNSLRV